MRGGTFLRDYNEKEPTVRSWLNALHDARGRTIRALKGINPWDVVVEYMREKHHLLIGEPTAEKIQIELGGADPEHPRTMTIQGRNLDSGLPATLEINSTEIQALDNSQMAQPYVDWSAEPDGQTIGKLLYTTAVNEANWLFSGVLQQVPPDGVEALFERDAEKLPNFVHGQTMAQHHQRLRIIREHLYQAYRGMTLEDFQRGRREAELFCSAEWVAHELCQFEAERRVEISSLLAAARKALDTKTVEQ